MGKRGHYNVPTPESRFAPKVNREGPVPGHAPTLGPCWLWTAACDARGYGRFGVANRRTVLAHRFAFEIAVGPIPEGMTLDHLCLNPTCVNPAHLEPCTTQENTRRAAAAGRMAVRWNTGRTHCIHGHPFDEANTRVGGRGERHCRTCDAERLVARSEQRRQERIVRYGYDPGPRARFDPAKAVRT